MASPIDTLANLPPWQRAVLWVVVGILIAVAWYFVWYSDAVVERDQAHAGLQKAEAELAEMEKKLENFEEEQRKAAEMEQQIRELMEELPMSPAVVDNLMQTFQQQARSVGLTVESWTPGGEEKLDYYAKMPVKVRASGTWHEVGEFFRRVTELRKIVSVENLKLKTRTEQGDGVDGHAILDVEFDASTYRFLTDQERVAATKKSTRRGGGG
jgi:type IV pilus assembly protein PilO